MHSGDGGGVEPWVAAGVSHTGSQDDALVVDTHPKYDDSLFARRV